VLALGREATATEYDYYRYRSNKKLSYCWETMRRESMPSIAEMDVEMTTYAEMTFKCTSRS